MSESQVLEVKSDIENINGFEVNMNELPAGNSAGFMNRLRFLGNHVAERLS